MVAGCPFSTFQCGTLVRYQSGNTFSKSFKGRSRFKIIPSVRDVGAGDYHVVEIADLSDIKAPDSDTDPKQSCLAEIGRLDQFPKGVVVNIFGRECPNQV